MASKPLDDRPPTRLDRWLSRVFDAGTGDGRRTDVVPWTPGEKLLVRRWLAAVTVLCLVGFGFLVAARRGASPSKVKPILGLDVSLIISIALGMAVFMMRAWRRARRAPRTDTPDD